MELNEYAIWKCRINRMERQYVQDGDNPQLEFAGHANTLVDATIVAPKGKLGRALLDVHFDKAFQVSQPLPSGKRWEHAVEPVEEPLHNIIRYEDAYRGRM